MEKVTNTELREALKTVCDAAEKLFDDQYAKEATGEKSWGVLVEHGKCYEWTSLVEQELVEGMMRELRVAQGWVEQEERYSRGLEVLNREEPVEEVSEEENSKLKGSFMEAMELLKVPSTASPALVGRTCQVCKGSGCQIWDKDTQKWIGGEAL